MKKLFILIFFCLSLSGCIKTKSKISEITDLKKMKQKSTSSYQIYTEQIMTTLPNMEITAENIFSEFPKSPDYFCGSDIDVTVEMVDERLSQTPHYFGLEPVYVTGKNFIIIYASDNGYEIMQIILRGESIFSYWNPFFHATWDDVKNIWGEPQKSMSYNDSSGWYFVNFTQINKATGRIEEIRIGKNP